MKGRYLHSISLTILALQYPDSGKLSTDVPDVDTGIDWLVYLAQYSLQCQAQSRFVVRSRLDIVENTEIMAGPNQSFYCGTLWPDCRPFRTGIFTLAYRKGCTWSAKSVHFVNGIFTLYIHYCLLTIVNRFQLASYRPLKLYPFCRADLAVSPLRNIHHKAYNNKKAAPVDQNGFSINFLTIVIITGGDLRGKGIFMPILCHKSNLSNKQKRNSGK